MAVNLFWCATAVSAVVASAEPMAIAAGRRNGIKPAESVKTALWHIKSGRTAGCAHWPDLCFKYRFALHVPVSDCDCSLLVWG
jgi:hypothetical protein